MCSEFKKGEEQDVMLILYIDTNVMFHVRNRGEMN